MDIAERLRRRSYLRGDLTLEQIDAERVEAANALDSLRAENERLRAQASRAKVLSSVLGC